LREIIRTRSMAEGRSYEREMTLPGASSERAGTTDPAKADAVRATAHEGGEAV
jgi:hypothetical protein